jgi:hypothetical protein
MTDEYDRTVLLIDDALCCRNVIVKTRERLLDDAHAVAVFDQHVMNAAPS